MTFAAAWEGLPMAGIHETVIYAADVPTTAWFYSAILGLRAIGETDADSAALRLPAGDAVLLIFRPEHARREGRGVPAHGTEGAGHLALRVAAGSLGAWREHLGQHGVPVELERGWARGGRSVYVRDPAGNSVELIDGEVWPA